MNFRVEKKRPSLNWLITTSNEMPVTKQIAIIAALSRIGHKLQRNSDQSIRIVNKSYTPPTCLDPNELTEFMREEGI